MARGVVAPFGLSYHLLSVDHQLLQYDNARQWFTEPLLPGDSRTIDVPVRVPAIPGSYQLEFDVVWEGVTWFKSQGNEAPRIALAAVEDAAPAPPPALHEAT